MVTPLDRAAFHAELLAIVGQGHLFDAVEDLEGYATDETHERRHCPDWVVRPGSVEEVAAIARTCNTYGVPLVARGGGSGVSGGALPVRGGVVVLMERLNRVVAVDRENMTVKVEAGVITGELQSLLVAQGLCLPPDPGSRSWCQIGGNLAEMAAGPKSVKYGAFRDYVLNLQVVLANGEILWTAADVRKIACGYNLSQLMLGSEGTLGLITQAVFRLVPAPTEELVLRLAFGSLAAARDLICQLFAKGLVPSEVEFMEAGAIRVTRPFCSEQVPDTVEVLLWIGFDGRDADSLLVDAEQVNALAEALGVLEVLVATEAEHRRNLWAYRHKVGESIIHTTQFLDVDVCFPRSRIDEVVEAARRIANTNGFQVVAFGHCGDGNLHVQILRYDLADDQWAGPVREGIAELYRVVVGMGGALSGEHGIGCTLTPYLNLMFSPTHLGLMRAIKAVFDPKNILNPGKILPESD